MAKVRVMYWKEIPVQVQGEDDSGRVSKELDARFHWPWWLSPVVLAAVFIAGVVADTLTSSGRIDIIAFPLLGLFLWNIAIYGFLGGRRFIAWKKKEKDLRISRLSAWFPKKLFAILPWPDFPREEEKRKCADIWRAAAGSFSVSWLQIERPVIQERLKILSHGAAIALLRPGASGLSAPAGRRPRSP